ncbi:MAG: hypothetical protein AAGA03_01450 [Planctomycetota bacterium]
MTVLARLLTTDGGMKHLSGERQTSAGTAIRFFVCKSATPSSVARNGHKNLYRQRQSKIRIMIIDTGRSKGNMQIVKAATVIRDRRITIARKAEKAHVSQQHTDIGSQSQIHSLASLPDSRPSHTNRVDKKNAMQNRKRNM